MAKITKVCRLGWRLFLLAGLLVPAVSVLLLVGFGVGEMLASFGYTAVGGVTAWIPPSVRDFMGQAPLVLGAFGAAGDAVVIGAPPLAVLGGLTWFSGGPAALFQGLGSSLGQAVTGVGKFLVGHGPLLAIVPPVLKASAYCIALPSLFFGSNSAAESATGSLPPVKPVYVVYETDPVLLPIHVLVYFDNAAIDADGDLTGGGTALDASGKGMLRTTMDTLEECVTSERDVTIQPYGFASDDPFLGLSERRSDKLNAQAAYLRAQAVHQVLEESARDGLTIQRPVPWEDVETMRDKRGSMIPVPAGTKRDAFADRVVVLRLSDLGRCAMAEATSAR